MNIYKLLFSGIVVSILLFSCKTTKKKGEISGLKKFYHNTTAYYNGYFNADELLDNTVLQLEESFVDNYTRLLPVYKFMSSPNIEGARPQIDTAIKKVSVVVAVHEPSEWVDDCYMLAGKAQYIKQDYEDAEKTLRYMVTEFNPADPNSLYWEYKKKPGSEKKRGKKKNRKKSKEYNTVYTTEASGENAGMFKNKPAFQLGQYWLGRTLIERDKISEAERMLMSLHGKSKGEFKTELSLALAHLHIEKKDYDKAIPFLEYAEETHKQKTKRARYAFILGQIYEMQSDAKNASKYYSRAESSANSYELIFNSKLNAVISKHKNGLVSYHKTLKTLEKMEKDDKNTEYLNQLYFTSARIHLEENREGKALKDFRRSLAESGSNTNINAESYYALSQLYFKKDKFIETKLYLDSTLLILNESDERHDKITSQRRDLEPIYEKLYALQLKDSLLMIAHMDDDEKKALAVKLKEQEMKKNPLGAPGAKNVKRHPKYNSPGRGNTQATIPVAGRGNTNPNRRNNNSTGFFAYSDEKDKERSFKNFENIWGERPLVDNWRISSVYKEEIDIAVESEENGAQEEQTSREVVVSGAEMERLFADVPKSSQDIKLMENEIAGLLSELGFLYRNNLRRPDLSIEVLEELISRFDNNQYLKDAYYNLYLAYHEIGRPEKAKKYAALIGKKYPDSDYAKVINDPNYLKKLQNKEQKLEKFYSEAFEEFSSGNYSSVTERLAQVASLYGPKNTYAAKFALLDAMNTGKTKGEEEYADKLRMVVSKFSGSSEAVRAKEILRFLNGDTSALGNGSSNAEFKREDDKLHYVIAAIRNAKAVDMNKAKISVSDFNIKYYKLSRLNISTQYLDIKDNGSPLLIIRRFDNKKNAMTYYETVKQFEDKFLPKGAKYDLYAITQQNYREILKERSTVGYREFFENNYLKEN